MTKAEEREELARRIEGWLVKYLGRRGDLSGQYPEMSGWLADDLTDAGYRRLPQGSIEAAAQAPSAPDITVARFLGCQIVRDGKHVGWRISELTKLAEELNAGTVEYWKPPADAGEQFARLMAAAGNAHAVAPSPPVKKEDVL